MTVRILSEDFGKRTIVKTAIKEIERGALRDTPEGVAM